LLVCAKRSAPEPPNPKRCQFWRTLATRCGTMNFRRLREAGIHFPLTLGLPICERCDTAVEPNKSSFVEHFRKQPHSLKSCEYNALWDIIAQLSSWEVPNKALQDQYMETRRPRSSSERLPQLPGLSTIPIFKCPHCNHFASSMKALSQHIRQMRHQDGVIVTVKGLANVERCNGQKL